MALRFFCQNENRVRTPAGAGDIFVTEEYEEQNSGESR